MTVDRLIHGFRGGVFVIGDENQLRVDRVQKFSDEGGQTVMRRFDNVGLQLVRIQVLQKIVLRLADDVGGALF